MEWNGALRWYATNAKAPAVRNIVEQVGGHANLFRNQSHEHQVFHPLPAALLEIHQKLKRAFDPEGILNPGKMYPEF